jgi:hypothetical protein
MFQVVQENNMLKMKYYELLNTYNKLKTDNDRMERKSLSEIEHLNKINAFLQNKTVDLNKTIVDKNKQMLYILNEKNKNKK